LVYDDDDDDFPGDDDNENPCDSLDFGFGTFGCYDLVFPISFVLDDGSIVTAADEDALGEIFLNNNGLVDFAYPVNLEDEDGESYVANNEEELLALLEECDEFDGGWDDEDNEWEETVVLPLTFMSINSGGGPGAPANCYAYVYPVTVVNGDGEETTANNDDEMLNAVFSSNGSVDFVYPVSVTSTETGETLTANNEEEAIALVEACEG